MNWRKFYLVTPEDFKILVKIRSSSYREYLLNIAFYYIYCILYIEKRYQYLWFYMIDWNWTGDSRRIHLYAGSIDSGCLGWYWFSIRSRMVGWLGGWMGNEQGRDGFSAICQEFTFLNFRGEGGRGLICQSLLRVLGDPEVTANLYCDFAYLYWEGCVICSIYLR